MINKIVDIALGNRAVVLVLIAALVVAGLLSIQRLPFDADPDISPLQVLVTTQAPGLAPPDVKRAITTPIELALQGLPGMTSYRSISRYGLSVIYVKFADGGDILTDRALVAQRLSQTALPAGAGTPMLGPLSDGLSESYQFKVEGKNYSDWQVAPQIKQVPGVTDVNVNGGELRTYEVRVSDSALVRFGLSIDDLYNAVAQNNRAAGERAQFLTKQWMRGRRTVLCSPQMQRRGLKLHIIAVRKARWRGDRGESRSEPSCHRVNRGGSAWRPR
jgi:cobalt-zinc-cadmium resistance protein CzcA